MKDGYTAWKDGALLDVKAIRRQKAVSTNIPIPVEAEQPRSE